LLAESGVTPKRTAKLRGKARGFIFSRWVVGVLHNSLSQMAGSSNSSCSAATCAVERPASAAAMACARLKRETVASEGLTPSQNACWMYKAAPSPGSVRPTESFGGEWQKGCTQHTSRVERCAPSHRVTNP
jgi:invasion protein IalB